MYQIKQFLKCGIDYGIYCMKHDIECGPFDPEYIYQLKDGSYRFIGGDALDEYYERFQ